MNRYEKLFDSLASRGEGAFVPFIMLSDPDPESALTIARAAIRGGADALELGVPFSDPVADGPTIQRSHVRALAGGSTVDSALDQVRSLRAEFPDLPLGMLIYGDVAFSPGLDRFYETFHEAGADSILLPDIPVRESRPFVDAARRHGIDPVFIAPAQASPKILEEVAAVSRGYIYAISRDGVTGTERESSTTGLADVVRNISRFGGAPTLLGFGISEPAQVRDAIAAGASGAITGSAITAIIERHCAVDPDKPSHSQHDIPASTIDDLDALARDIEGFVASMKAATRG